MTTIYHISDKGPKICKATVRKCKYAESGHGSKAEMTEKYELSQTEEHQLFATHKKTPASLIKSRQLLQDSTLYTSDSRVYDEETVAIAKAVAASTDSPLSHVPVKEEDKDFEVNSISTVKRIILENGSVGYFKGFAENSAIEYHYISTGTSSLGATINEVNAYRLAQLMGKDYADLVPETVIREVNGELGSFQKEIKASSYLFASYKTYQSLRDDYRRAGIYDFVAGSLDRHDENFLYESTSDGVMRIRLIDNAASFSSHEDKPVLGHSIFTHDEFDMIDYSMHPNEHYLTPDDKTMLENTKKGIDEWEKNGTISPKAAAATKDRIDSLLSTGAIYPLEEYYLQKQEEDLLNR